MVDATVNLWGRRVGAVSWDANRSIGIFQYDPAFVRSGAVQLSPFQMPLREAPYEFPRLRDTSFSGLPGLLSDSLPDKFGTVLVNKWLTENNIDINAFTPVERLCYTATRGMGALEFSPAIGPPDSHEHIKIDQLVELTNLALAQREAVTVRLQGMDDREGLQRILRVGASAGGQRPKAVLSWNPQTGEFRSGQIAAMEGFEPWMLKFDGVSSDGGSILSDAKGYGRIEYAYHLMAKAAGIFMSPCHLHEEGGRAHFMTRRFDRGPHNEKTHMQSLAGLLHLDYNQVGAHRYEQAMSVIADLDLGLRALQEQFRRICFNIAARNQDDHVKNIAFLMDQNGRWELSPAYDVTYSYNPDGPFAAHHQMSVCGKFSGFERRDLLTFADRSGIARQAASSILDTVLAAVRQWPRYAREASVPDYNVARISRVHRVAALEGGSSGGTTLVPAANIRPSNSPS